MNATSDHPYFRFNRCKCGHAFISHSGGVDTTNTDCVECPPLGTNPNKHIFEHMTALGPLPPNGSFFLCSDLQGYCNPGGLGTSFQKTLAVAASKGAPIIQFLDTIGIVPGVSFTSYPAGNLGNTVTYTVFRVQGVSVILDRPLDFNILTSNVFIFDGTHSSSMGPGRPSRNYQRGG
jgi:hypothetical protein